jgi:hypothetical protein
MLFFALTYAQTGARMFSRNGAVEFERAEFQTHHPQKQSLTVGVL